MTDGSHLAALGPGDEFDKIRHIWRTLGGRALNGGDDAAVVQFGDRRLAVCSDLAVEDVHFRLGWITPREIGWRAAAATLSDQAAVAAKPHGVLVSLGVPSEWPDDFVAELMDGAGAMADSAGAKIWGGDLVRTDKVIVDVVALGEVGTPIMRTGAEPGDLLCVTGALGGPLIAVRNWQNGSEPDAAARARFAHPQPRIVEGQWLAQHGAKAMIDVSDGLVSDAGQLAAGSSCGCRIDAQRVPLHPSVTESETALLSGEEFELLVVLPHDVGVSVCDQFAEDLDITLTPIGEVEADAGVRVVRDGAALDLPDTFRHF